VSVAILLAIVFTLIATMAAINVFMYLYGQSVVRAAIDEGVRAGSRVAAGPDACETRANQVVDDLLGGPFGSGVSIDCHPSAVTGELVAVADVTFTSPLPGVPAWSFQAVAHATQETGE
jgi:hypothetical protein